MTTQHPHEVEYIQLELWPAGLAAPKPWSTIPEDVRERINGIMLLKLRLTEEDIKLFPNLKVYVFDCTYNTCRTLVNAYC